MNELDFIDALSNRDTKRATAAREFLGKLKTSGVKDLAATALQFTKSHAPEIAAGLTGAGLVGAGTYLRSKGKPSPDQRLTQSLLVSTEAMKDHAERDGRPISFREDMTAAIAPSAKNLADVFARHPVKGAVLVAPMGALAGLRILKALK